MGIKSKIKSAARKVGSAAKSYAKNVVGGAKIVGSAVSSAAKKVGGTSQTGTVLNAVVPKGTSIAPKKVEQPGFISGGKTYTSAGLASSGLPKATSTGVQIGPQLNAFQGPLINPKTGASSFKDTGRTSTPSNNTSSTTDSTALSVGQFGGDNSSSFSSFSSSPSLGSRTPNAPSTNVINTPTLGTQNTKLTFPEPETPDYSQYIPTPIETQAEDAKDGTEDALKDYLKELNKAPDSADAYEKAQRETDILAKQQLVGDLTGQLNGIVAKGQANQLSLVGQGRGIPEAIIGGQQAQIGRETAIAALPVQAQLSAAQESYEAAEESLNTLYKIYAQDAQNEYENRKETKKLVYEYASQNEKRALEKLDKQEDREYEERQVVLKDIKDIATQAMQNQAPAGVLSNIFNAKTYREAVSAAGKYGGEYLQRELLLQQIENVKSQIRERENVADSYGTISGKPQNAAQSSANGYANRVAESDVIISNLGKKFTGKLSIGGSLPNIFQSGDRQMYEQAKRNFINSVLRRESGAAISESEFVSAEKQYFPQAGDLPATLVQKESSRNTTINNLYREAGVNRPVLPGQIIESNGVRYRVGMDGETLDIIQ